MWTYVVPGRKSELVADWSNTAEVVAWKEGDQRARATRFDDQAAESDHIRNATAREKLKQQQLSLISKVHLLKRICDLSCHIGDDIAEHLLTSENLFVKFSNHARW